MHQTFYIFKLSFVCLEKSPGNLNSHNAAMSAILIGNWHRQETEKWSKNEQIHKCRICWSLLSSHASKSLIPCNQSEFVCSFLTSSVEFPPCRKHKMNVQLLKFIALISLTRAACRHIQKAACYMHTSSSFTRSFRKRITAHVTWIKTTISVKNPVNALFSASCGRLRIHRHIGVLALYNFIRNNCINMTNALALWCWIELCTLEETRAKGAGSMNASLFHSQSFHIFRLNAIIHPWCLFFVFLIECMFWIHTRISRVGGESLNGWRIIERFA